MSTQRLPVASDEWMAEQQLRAELEAEAWRRMRQTALAPPQAPAAPPAPDPSLAGSIVLKALVRFAMGASASYLAYIAAIDAQLGSFEAWLAVIAAFLVTLALSLLAPLRRVVHAVAETARWTIIVALGLGLLWLTLNNPGA